MQFTYDISSLVAGIVFVFSLIFWFTSREETCWYRRYMLPLMAASLALVLEPWWAKLAVLISAGLIYDGYHGYGRERMTVEARAGGPVE